MMEDNFNAMQMIAVVKYRDVYNYVHPSGVYTIIDSR